ncbi:MAG: hypothetical protein K1X55_05740 [Chitinophagales bacterium]|nr:hypothetical protein [Chitinophagales bacterium]
MKHQQIQHTVRTIWVHAASSGEMMTAIPLLEKLQEKTGLPIVCSFFSPSGYNFFLTHPLPQKCLILPLPTETNIAQFIQQINPEICLWMKNEFWLEYLQKIHKMNIPLYWIDVNLKNKLNIFNKLIFSNLYLFNKIFTLNKNLPNSPQIMQTNTLKFDSVLPLFDNIFEHPKLEKYAKNKTTIILGSCHAKDINIWIDYAFKYPKQFSNINWIIAPHEPQDISIKNMLRRFPYYTYSSANFLSNIIYVDTIGDLRYLYKFTDGAFIGGGFNKGVHNVLEAAIYSVSVCFGPHYKSFPEATTLLENNLAMEIHSVEDFSLFIEKFIPEKKTTSNALAHTNPSFFGSTHHVFSEIMVDYERLSAKFLRH